MMSEVSLVLPQARRQYAEQWRRTKPTLSATSGHRPPLAMRGRRYLEFETRPRHFLFRLRRRKIAALDEPNEFVPFGMRQRDGIFVLPDRDPLVGNHDLRAFGAIRAKGQFDQGHLW